MVNYVRIHIWYWSASTQSWFESTSFFDKRILPYERQSYRNCGWCTAVEKRVVRPAPGREE
jgi:hypothetical protein